VATTYIEANLQQLTQLALHRAASRHHEGCARQMPLCCGVLCDTGTLTLSPPSPELPQLDKPQPSCCNQHAVKATFFAILALSSIRAPLVSPISNVSLQRSPCSILTFDRSSRRRNLRTRRTDIVLGPCSMRQSPRHLRTSDGNFTTRLGAGQSSCGASANRPAASASASARTYSPESLEGAFWWMVADCSPPARHYHHLVVVVCGVKRRWYTIGIDCLLVASLLSPVAWCPCECVEGIFP
jgi:hypothetical protein